MASYTIAAFEKIFEEIKGLGFFLSLFALLLSIITQIIKICTSSGVLWLNIALLSITTICFIFCILHCYIHFTASFQHSSFIRTPLCVQCKPTSRSRYTPSRCSFAFLSPTLTSISLRSISLFV